MAQEIWKIKDDTERELAYAAQNSNRVVVDAQWLHAHPEATGYLYNIDAKKNNLDPWTTITGVDMTLDGDIILDYGRCLDMEVKPDFKIMVSQVDYDHSPNYKTDCMECGETVEKLYSDERNPPLDIKPCLCAECHDMSVMEEMESTEHDIDCLKGRSLHPEPEETSEETAKEFLYRQTLELIQIKLAEPGVQTEKELLNEIASLVNTTLTKAKG